MLPALLILFSAGIGLWLFRSRVALETLYGVPSVPLLNPSPAEPSSVTVVIPARNEEKNLPQCLRSLEVQLDSQTQCLVINDRSTDATEMILQRAGFSEIAGKPNLSFKRYVHVRQNPPEGWTGKNHALTCAVPYLSGGWLLFTDADTLHQSSGIRSAIVHAEKNGLDLLTLTPRCLTGSFIERLVQPTAMAMMGLWFPLTRVNDPQKPDHFANGQYLLIRRDLYETLGTHAAVAHEFLEDFALMKKAKQTGARTACHWGQEIYGTRMYHNLRELWRGWRRIYRHALDCSVPLILVRLAGLLTASVLPAIGLAWLFVHAAPENPLWKPAVFLGSLCMILITGVTVKTYRTLQTPWAYAFLHPVAALIVAGILVDALRISLLNLKTRWRE